MLTDLLTFLQGEWELISANPWSFCIFGVFLFLIGFSISWVIHNYTMEVKLHNIPEREALQRKVADLQNQNDELKKALHRLDIKGLIQELRDGNKEESIGEIIARNK